MPILTIFPFLQGVNQLHIVFILDIILIGLLLYKINKNKRFIFTKDIKFILILLWSFSYLLTMLWSVDTELSWLGFLKFFTIPLFLITVMQYKYTKEQKDKWFDVIAKLGAIMVAIILVISIIERIATGENNVFFYQNRLAGFFQYANSFALFLLIGIIVTGFKKGIKSIDFVVMNILLIGILLTNSRAIMIITFFSYLLILIFNKELRKKNFINLGIMVIVGIIVTIIMNQFGVSNRISQTSGSSSEWVLRLLYYKDALRMAVKNIFGHGYLAWWYMQEGLQTGAYDAQFVHNGLLQIVLDAGVIAALSVVVIFIMGFFDKKVTARDRVLMLVILGHAIMDFDMEFLAITLILFMTLEFDKKKELTKIRHIKYLFYGCGLIYVFFAGVTILNEVGEYQIVNSMFPYSISLNNELEKVESSDKRVEIAEKLYSKNKYFLNSSKILSNKEQHLENYDMAEEYEYWIMKNKKYTMRYYIEYIQFLENAIKYYYSQNDIESVKNYIDKLCEVPSIVNNVLETSDKLAFDIVHKPRLDIPKEVTDYIEQMKLFKQNI